MPEAENASPATPEPISATPEARAALQKITAEFGPVMFHTSGGRIGGRNFPILLPRQELRLGPRDHLLGEIEGTPVYEMEDKEGGKRCDAGAYVLDLSEGPTIGFSIPAAPGKRFTLMPTSAPVCSTGDSPPTPHQN